MIKEYLLGFELEKAIIILNNSNLDYQIHKCKLSKPRFPLSNRKRIMAIKGLEPLEVYVAFEQEPLV